MRTAAWWSAGASRGLLVGLAAAAAQTAAHDSTTVAVETGVFSGGVVALVVVLYLRWRAAGEPAGLRALGPQRRADAVEAARDGRTATDPELRSDAELVLRHDLAVSRRLRRVVVGVLPVVIVAALVAAVVERSGGYVALAGALLLVVGLFASAPGSLERRLARLAR